MYDGPAPKPTSAHSFVTRRNALVLLTRATQVGTVLPFYPGKGPALGAVLTMSRYPCSSDDAVLAGQCCRKQKCANYSGAHVVSRGCILYGTLEAELAVHIPGGVMRCVPLLVGLRLMAPTAVQRYQTTQAIRLCLIGAHT